MKPSLIKVKLKEVKDDLSIVEVTYEADDEIKGVELMGLDAGLSWIKDESIKLDLIASEDEAVVSTAPANVSSVESVSSLEFQSPPPICQ